MAASWRSEAIPERDQFSSWREACCQHVYAITPEREDEGRFRGSIQARRVGGLDVVDLQCEGHRVLRRAEDIRGAPSETYYVYCQIGEAAWFLQGDRHVLALRGDIVLADPNIPFSTGASGDFDFRIWRVPRRSLDGYLARPGRLPMIHLPFNSPECSLVSACLDALAAPTGVWDCTYVGECSTACPKHVDPAGAIQRYKLTAANATLKAFLLPRGGR